MGAIGLASARGGAGACARTGLAQQKKSITNSARGRAGRGIANFAPQKTRLWRRRERNERSPSGDTRAAADGPPHGHGIRSLRAHLPRKRATRFWSWTSFHGLIGTCTLVQEASSPSRPETRNALLAGREPRDVLGISSGDQGTLEFEGGRDDERVDGVLRREPGTAEQRSRALRDGARQIADQDAATGPQPIDGAGPTAYLSQDCGWHANQRPTLMRDRQDCLSKSFVAGAPMGLA